MYSVKDNLTQVLHIFLLKIADAFFRALQLAMKSLEIRIGSVKVYKLCLTFAVSLKGCELDLGELLLQTDVSSHR